MLKLGGGRAAETVLCICNVKNRAISDTSGVDEERRVACLDVAAGRPAGLEADWTSHDAVIVDLNSPVHQFIPVGDSV